jgi:hypothetical protein
MSNSNDDTNNMKNNVGDGGGSEPSAATPVVMEDGPTLRSVQMMPRPGFRQHVDVGMLKSSGMSKSEIANSEIIDKSSYFSATKEGSSAVEKLDGDSSDFFQSNWSPAALRPIPAYYPLEKSSRLVGDENISVVAARVSECLRMLSVQADYDNNMATAALCTPEHVEMHLSLWQGSGKYPQGIIAELQRRKGDALTFHMYCRHILDAAVGNFDAIEFAAKNGQDVNHAYSKMAERLLTSEAHIGKSDEKKNSYIALEIAASLLKKDRMDARQLGMESLCLLTDPKKTCLSTAIIASRVVLLGTAQDEKKDSSGALDEEDIMFEMSHLGIREAILSLVQFRRLGDDGDYDDYGEKDEGYDSDDGSQHRYPEEKEHNDLLHNLALAVLANSLDVIENCDMEQTLARNHADSGESKACVADCFLSDAEEISKRDILKTLIGELGRASGKPHDACLSAKCLGSLFTASKDARRRAQELKALKVVNTALEIGQRTHVKLETETRKIVKTLSLTTTNQTS